MNNDVFYYQIKEGDYPYKVAKEFNVTLAEILRVNPGMDPLDLQIGSYIAVPRTTENQNEFNQLQENLRTVWQLYADRVRPVITSIIDNTGDEEENIRRLMEMPQYTGGIFEEYYGVSVGNIIRSLLINHLMIIPQLVHAVVDQQSVQLNQLNSEWHSNADTLAVILSSINPYFNEQEIKDMFYALIDELINAILFRIQAEYSEEIDAFADAERLALMIADYLSNGIYRQFGM